MRKYHTLCWALPLAISFGSVASAQGTPDAATCKQVLTAAAEDSQVVRLSITIASFDTAHRLSPIYATMLGEGLRQVLTLPRVLPLDVYDGRASRETSLTIRGSYRTTLRADGRFTATRAVGGTRNSALDSAVLAGIAALDTSGLVPPPHSSTSDQAETFDLRILVAPDATWSTGRTAPDPAPRDGVIPIVRLRVPIRHFMAATPKPGNPAPRYPEAMRMGNVQGNAMLEFVVDATGLPDVTTVQVLRANALPFVEAILEDLPKLRFAPMTISGCAVASLVMMPFEFSLTRP